MPNADHLVAADPFANLLGISVVSQSTDQLVLALEVTEEMANFLGGTHGGLIFSLADVALSVISNAERTALAISANISYVAGCSPGATLTATARAVKDGRSIATYQIGVRDSEDRHIAQFVGTVYKPGADSPQ